MANMERIKGKVNPTFWNRKRVFLTGHTGFKGSWLSLWLLKMGATVKGFALDPTTNPSLFLQTKLSTSMESEIFNISDLTQLTTSMLNFNPDVLIHMAAQPLVRYSYKDPVETYATNVLGTVNVLEAARKCKNFHKSTNFLMILAKFPEFS